MPKRKVFCLKYKFLPLGLILLSIIFLVGCSKNNPAPVANIGLDTKSIKDTILIRSQDTLWSISKRFKLPIQDILAVNELAPPYRLKIGQRVKLPKPNIYVVRENDTLYTIANMFDVSITGLVQINNIRPPYRIHTGQKLRIPAKHNHRIAKNDHNNSYKYQKTNNPKRYKITRPAGKRPTPYYDDKKQYGLYNNTKKYNNNAKFIWPVRGKILSSYGPKSGGLHNDGINIAVPKGTPVKSADNGKVVYVGDDLSSFGNLILIRHAGGWISAYGHLDGTKVSKGDIVKKGDIIGTVGSTGNVKTPQLHFELRRGSKAINPEEYLT